MQTSPSRDHSFVDDLEDITTPFLERVVIGVCMWILEETASSGDADDRDAPATGSGRPWRKYDMGSKQQLNASVRLI